MLMQSMQNSAQQKDKNSEDQKETKKQESKKNTSGKKKIKRMRFLETEEESEKRKDTDSLA